MILAKYSNTGQFVFADHDRLSRACNAPGGDSAGVYLVYGITGGHEELIYIGRSGKASFGKIKNRKGGIKHRIVAGKQFGEARRTAWPKQMKAENISQLRVAWYVTHDDCPDAVERRLRQDYEREHGRRPRWNKS
jgi:hypothetical protein